MKPVYLFPLALLLLSMTSCEAIGDIFGAGFNAGIIVSILAVVVVIWLLMRFMGGRRP